MAAGLEEEAPINWEDLVTGYELREYQKELASPAMRPGRPNTIGIHSLP